MSVVRFRVAPLKHEAVYNAASFVMNYFCYILFSPSLDKFYTGSTSNSIKDRLKFHLSGHYGKSKFTYPADDWQIFLEIQCSSYKQAMGIERHIKKMKSKQYILNLKKYHEIIQKLLSNY